MTWIDFPLYSSIIVFLWCIGLIFLLISYKKQAVIKIANLLFVAGWGVMILFVVKLWLELDRPPMRTLGETRLWYSFFLPVVGVITFVRWRYRWILSFSTLMAIVFCFINLLKPEIHNKTLMPALQSPWFAPHVIVYMFAYAVLGAAFVVAVYLLWKQKTVDSTSMEMCDNLVYVGEAFLTIGMLFGAIWAKEAWGHYWSWDPKETWAAATWLGYLIYIHYRSHHASRNTPALIILIFAFLLLQMCWFGINYLPAAQGNSIHVYNM